MTMESRPNGFSNSTNGFNFDDGTLSPNLDQSESFSNMFKIKEDPKDLSFWDVPFLPSDPNPGFVATTSNGSSELDSPEDSDNVLKYINSILMEENIEQKPSMFLDPLALQAAEKSLYDVIGENYLTSPNQSLLYFNQNVDSPDDYLFGSYSEQSTYSNTSDSNSVESQWIIDPGSFKPSEQSYPSEYPSETTSQTTSESPYGLMKGFSGNVNGLMDSSVSNNLVSSIFSNSESILQFKRGMEEASKFLPKDNQLIINLDTYALPPGLKGGAPKIEVKEDKEGRENSSNGSRGKRNHHREEAYLEEERSSKQSAVFVEESELSDMFDKVLLGDMKAEPGCFNVGGVKSEPVDAPQQNGVPNGSNSSKNRAKKQGNNKDEAVDLRTLLINCAQSVAADDRRTATEQLNHIRKNCSPLGDGSQRVANIFAKGLDARLAGTGSQRYAALAAKRISAAAKLKAYKVYLSCCPFKKISMSFANKLILDLVLNSTKKKLHIIDFGILYGFQWPILIQYFATLPDGPPELRITGIDFPRPGFRPAEMVEETGRRLAKYCERFNVPFQYHSIAQKWETIKLEDLDLHNDEAIAVNCLFRFKNLLDETVSADSPRDAVLKLIRKINPDIFIPQITNGSFSAPFFVTRFREALFHYSSYFDMFDTTIESRENQERMNFEQEFYGREVMNIVACEGVERVERPETYKQWQVRITRAGFKIQPLTEELLKKLKVKVAGYHKDFVIDEDGTWLLQGWKGRILYASSCWVPA